MNKHELSRIKQNRYEFLKMNQLYDLYKFIWYYTERRVTMGGSLAFTVWVCELTQNMTWINMTDLE
jgi:hypothetical protein